MTHAEPTPRTEGERDALLEEAYEGEIIGEALYSALGRRALTNHQHHACRLLAELEAVTGGLLEPVVARHGVAVDPDAARRRGVEYAALMASDEWLEVLRQIVPLAQEALSNMQRLQQISDDEDRGPMDALVAHEEAFLEFARRESAGADDALGPLEHYLELHRPIAG
jgi:hypothetical protein